MARGVATAHFRYSSELHGFVGRRGGGLARGSQKLKCSTTKAKLLEAELFGSGFRSVSLPGLKSRLSVGVSGSSRQNEREVLDPVEDGAVTLC